MRSFRPLVIVLCSCLAAGPALAQIDEDKMTEQLDQLGELLGLPPVAPAELKEKVEEIGELDFRTDVPIDFMSREELSAYIRGLFEEDYPPDFAAREARMLRGFGLLDAGTDLRTVRERVLNENVAGFYDERPGVRKLFAISSGRSLNVMNQLILSHELRHAIQDQYVVIRDKLEVESDFDDRRLATLCLLEGDASILMEHYLTSGVTRNAPKAAGLFQVFSQSLTGEEVASMFAGPALKEAPVVVQEQLIAPYFDGQRFASSIYEEGGFALLNDKLNQPPRSMEQVLHPEKYLRGIDEPVEVDLDEAHGAAPDFEGPLGEFFIRLLLREGPSSKQSEAAAEGWGGDHYVVLPAEGGEGYRLVWRSTWDSERDAREFESALRAYVQARFAGEDVRVERSGRDVLFERPHFE
jgi:hypothetical protein